MASCGTNAVVWPGVEPLARARFDFHYKDQSVDPQIKEFAGSGVFGDADEIPQGWVPEALTLPDDAEVQMDRAIGSSIRMFSFSTEADVGKLFGEWSTELEDSGYNIRPQQAELEQSAIEFSGRNILNAKIVTAPASNGDRAVVSFDATLE